MILEDSNVEEVINKVYRYCFNMTSSHWIAEDITQEAMIKAWKIKENDIDRPLSITFLYTVARNLYIDKYRRQRDISFSSEELYVKHNDFLEWEELLQILCSALPLKKAMLIALKDVFKYTSLEIAQMLRVSEESIKTTLHRARKELHSKDLLHVKVDQSEYERPMLNGFINAIKNQNPNEIFYFYRLLETENYYVNCSVQKGDRNIHITDPDGNLLEIVC